MAEVLTLTDEARAKMRFFRQMHGDETAAVRITVHPEAPVEGKYELEFVALSSASGEDLRVQYEDLVLLIDPNSARLVQGTRVDYRQGMWSSGFRFESPDPLGLMSDPLAVRVQEVLEKEIGPMVAAHGGQVRLVDVREKRAFVQFGGGCQGCGLAPVTLKQGVVEALRKAVPEILEVVDLTNHAAGDNPYYPPAPRSG